MREPIVPTSKPLVRVNVTPIIDVALVLVIILLLTAPILSMSDLNVKLPGAHTREAEDSDRVSVTVSKDGALELESQRVELVTLAGTLRARLNETPDDPPLVVVRADASATHGLVQQVLDELRRAGAHRVAVATTQKGGQPR